MNPKLLFTFSLSFALTFLFNNFAKAQSHCCPLPDSLSVTSVTDSSFCIKWKVRDTIPCDTPYGAILIYRPISSTNWSTKKIKYDSVTKYYSYCDTLTACLKYQWKLRNVCIRNGDTTFTDYVKGPNFNAACDSLGKAKTNYTNLQVFPNPAHNTVTLKGKLENATKVNVTVSDIHGNRKFEKELILNNGAIQLSFDAGSWNKGVYFITVSDGKKSIKQNFVKE
jgi:hypothetical protein